MFRTMIPGACLLLLSAFAAMAQDGEPERKQPPSEAKELSGMSIVGNDEAPKSLYIVPWKSSELGDDARLNMRVDGNAVPVDRDVFLRQLAYYRIMTEDASHRP